MNRHFVIIATIAALAAPALAPAQTQSSTERERDRERERIERQREREEEMRARALERQDRDRDRRERDAAGSLDTVVTFDARGTVSVSCPGGAVVVTSGDRDEIRVKARMERGGIRFTSNGSRATLEPSSGRGCSDGRYEIIVPAGSRVSANTWSGSINVRGVAGDVDVHSLSGDIVVRDAGGRLDVETVSGDVGITGVSGESSVNTVSGDVTLDGARGPVEVESVSGDLQLRDLSARRVRTHTTSGDLTFSGLIVDAGRYEFETHSGELRLQLPANVGAQLSLSTFSGSIDSAFPITLTAGEHGMGASTKRMEFTLGQGTARIIAETFSGDITLTSSGRRK